MLYTSAEGLYNSSMFNEDMGPQIITSAQKAMKPF